MKNKWSFDLDKLREEEVGLHLFCLRPAHKLHTTSSKYSTAVN